MIFSISFQKLIMGFFIIIKYRFFIIINKISTFFIISLMILYSIIKPYDYYIYIYDIFHSHGGGRRGSYLIVLFFVLLQYYIFYNSNRVKKSSCYSSATAIYIACTVAVQYIYSMKTPKFTWKQIKAHESFPAVYPFSKTQYISIFSLHRVG